MSLLGNFLRGPVFYISFCMALLAMLDSARCIIEEGPDLLIESFARQSQQVESGAEGYEESTRIEESARIEVLVSNLGSDRSSATTLRYYLSGDPDISAELATAPVPALNVDESVYVEADIPVMPSQEHLYYSACIDSVEKELHTDNNCSPGQLLADLGGGDEPEPHPDPPVSPAPTPPVGSFGDDHSDTREGATDLPIGSSAGGKIEREEDIDYFRIVVEDSGRLILYATGDSDPVGTLEGSSGEQLAEDDDGGSRRNFRISQEVAPGIYYLRVEIYSGRFQLPSPKGAVEYRVHAEFRDQAFSGPSPAPAIPDPNPDPTPAPPTPSPPPVAADDHGDRAADATPLPVGWGSSLSGQLDSRRDQDYFRVDITTPGTLAVFTTGVADTEGRIYFQRHSYYDDNGGPGKNFRLEQSLPEGVAYIRVAASYAVAGSSYPSSYRIHLYFTPSIPDDHGDSSEEATLMRAGRSRAGEIEERGDVDYFRVALNEPGLLTAYTSGNSGTQLSFEDGEGNHLACLPLNTVGKNSGIMGLFDAGAYYIKVSGRNCRRGSRYTCAGTGLYDLHTSFAPQDGGSPQLDIGDDYPDSYYNDYDGQYSNYYEDLLPSIPLTLDPATNSYRGEIGGEIGHRGDVDYFTVSFPASGQATIYTTGAIDSIGTIAVLPTEQTYNRMDALWELEPFQAASLYWLLILDLGGDPKSSYGGGEGLNFRIAEQDVTSGVTYHIGVRSRSSLFTILPDELDSYDLGEYRLHVEFTEADEEEDAEESGETNEAEADEAEEAD